MTNIRFRKEPYCWLFGGMGFHNSEATMTGLMTEEFLNQRVLKSFHEISPKFSRLFAGYGHWTKEAMDEFADYYYKTFAKADTTLYAVPGRMPLHEDLEEMEAYVERVTKNLATPLQPLSSMATTMLRLSLRSTGTGMPSRKPLRYEMR